MEIMNIELECQYDKSCIKIVNNEWSSVAGHGIVLLQSVLNYIYGTEQILSAMSNKILYIYIYKVYLFDVNN
jgi:hypothetical protein